MPPKWEGCPLTRREAPVHLFCFSPTHTSPSYYPPPTRQSCNKCGQTPLQSDASSTGIGDIPIRRISGRAVSRPAPCFGCPPLGRRLSPMRGCRQGRRVTSLCVYRASNANRGTGNEKGRLTSGLSSFQPRRDESGHADALPSPAFPSSPGSRSSRGSPPPLNPPMPVLCAFFSFLFFSFCC